MIGHWQSGASLPAERPIPGGFDVRNSLSAMGHRCTGRNLSLLAGLVIAAASASGMARAQTDWPTRTVTIVVPYAAGGNTDIMARMASQKLTEAFKRSFIVEIASAREAPSPRTMSPRPRPTAIRCFSRPRR